MNLTKKSSKSIKTIALCNVSFEYIEHLWENLSPVIAFEPFEIENVQTLSELKKFPNSDRYLAAIR